MDGVKVKLTTNKADVGFLAVLMLGTSIKV